MSTYRHRESPNDTYKQRITYSKTRTDTLSVPYELTIKGRDTKLVLYFGGKRNHTQAIEVAMKEIPGSVVTGVVIKR